MLIYVGVTDSRWYKLLRDAHPDEVNFWQPSSGRNFKAIQAGELFLFKLHSPTNYIVGGGIFARQTILPISLTWEAFGNKNGVSSQAEFVDKIYQYRKTDRRSEPDPNVSSLILTSPFFFTEDQWIPVPDSWSSNIVQGKTYDTNTIEGRVLFDIVQERLSHMSELSGNTEQTRLTEPAVRYGAPTLITPRLGQGAFRIFVTEAYHRRCTITGEKTLPVLDATHIKPYANEGPHLVKNGLLMRQDMHTLFDRGYLTINEQYIIEVSRRIKEDYGNGKEYYAYHGKSLMSLPDNFEERPAKDFLLWHNENLYVG